MSARMCAFLETGLTGICESSKVWTDRKPVAMKEEKASSALHSDATNSTHVYEY